MSLDVRIADSLASVDSAVGNGIEAAVKYQHRRRLGRHGWSGALDGGPGAFSTRGTPPRPGCELEVLIDGAVAFAAADAAIRSARTSIWVAQWFLSPDFELVREAGALSVGALLAQAAERGVDVRVLVWAGSPVPLFSPNRSQVKAAVSELTRATQIHCELDAHERALHCHHEKTLVVDGEVAFVGGIDMTNLKNDRYDSADHPARRRSGWHDVGTRLTGPIVADVAAGFAMRWRELTGESLTLAEPPGPSGEHTVQMTRTVPEGMYGALPDGDFSVLESYIRAIEGAERFIYLENQFLWAPEITDRLADKLAHPPQEDFRLVILLPTKAHAGQDDTLGQVGVLEAADRGNRLLVSTLRSLSGERADACYVHAKVAVIDDAWLTVGSANLNAHSLLNDTEMNVVSDHAGLARDTRLKLWAEHLDVGEEEISGREPCAVIDEVWRPIAAEQRRRQTAGAPPTHHLVAMSGVSRRSRRLLGPLNGLLADG
jgi:phosphatidylserine/phosphatidylglycerophosphate/cardiolipin synthase-like enzyme